MLNKIKKSLAYRLPPLYRLILLKKKISLPTLPKSSVNVITMTGKSHIEMLKLCLISLFGTNRSLPELSIVNDGSLLDQEIIHALKFWPAIFKIESLENVYSYHNKRNRYALIEYAKLNAFGKKLAIILHQAEMRPTLWIDSDILFFKDFTSTLPNVNKEFFCGGSEDFVRAYHEKVLNNMKSLTVPKKNFNAGLLYVFGDSIYEKFNLENVIAEIHPHYDFLTEQTIFAHISTYSLEVIWTRKQIENCYDDNQSLWPTDTNLLIGRHYTSNVRHLFWRDAFFLVNFKKI